MDSPFPSSLYLWLLIIVQAWVFINIPSCSSKGDWYTNCRNNFTCGSLSAAYPFWGGSRPSGCGIPELELTCDSDTAAITINDVKYRVLEFHSDTRIIRIARKDFWVGICPPLFVNTSLSPPLLDYVNGYDNITLVYGCPTVNVFAVPGTFSCSFSGSAYASGYIMAGAIGAGLCYNSVYFPVTTAFLSVLTSGNLTVLYDWIRQGFEVEWNVVDGDICSDCTRSNGVCGYDSKAEETICYCPNQSNGLKICPASSNPESAPPDKSSNKLSLPIGLSIAGSVIVGIFLGSWLLVIAQRRKRKAAAETQSKELLSPPPINKNVHIPTADISLSIPPYPYSNSNSISKPKSDLEKGSSFFGVQVFSFTELEEATDNFDPSKELGSGGFGTVYYGVLRDGRSVAVKRLFENNMKRAEQFMNEVEILNRLRHKNLVTLYGCTSRRSRELILVYEYIPNGTVADHLHRGASNSGLLTWTVRFSIAIETADALAYLHASDVIHRDVKTNNILLDNKFRVKVADFGLSRLFPTNVTHVSTAPQGTPGYVDPEYYHTYQLTDKSDVYSFGVVLIELISSLPAVDTSRHRQDVNLANMAISKIQNHSLSELVDPVLGFDKDTAVRKMATSVAALAFRCLQQERDIRPTMDEVLQALKKIESENYGFQNARVLDIGEDDVGLLKQVPPTLSPDSDVA